MCRFLSLYCKETCLFVQNKSHIYFRFNIKCSYLITKRTNTIIKALRYILMTILTDVLSIFNVNSEIKCIKNVKILNG